MAALSCRSSRALKYLPNGNRQVRMFHDTSSAANPSPLLASERTSQYAPQRLVDLKSECRRRALKVSGSKAELAQRLMSHDIAHSRGFSSVVQQVSKRSTLSAATPQLKREFNVSTAMGAVRDDSTIDFAYMPDLSESQEQRREWVRVPLLPDNYAPQRSGANKEATEAIDTVIRPEISTVSPDNSHVSTSSAVTDVLDNSAAGINTQGLADSLSNVASKLAGTSAEELKQPGTLKTLWSGFLDDLLGPKGSSKH
ncbi:hypothetical protein L228DRAFT_244586 [Xylona heveae TC161]|uniref:SAP domain-containing protein n=1 Tax=Xylona heveae (strain CBS 132557 / TC161) TaxID=1328760 RepID=A0A165J416_XYLHT|nr:hypothetical protein L228DRAFT_244586 [Xylona heveae TC161]KZF25699.1 hypothetical protein L228DRAFT_244586 [Xylona heveae TC161]